MHCIHVVTSGLLVCLKGYAGEALITTLYLIGNATTVTVVLPTGEELVCDPVCEPVNSSDQVKKKSKEYSSQIWEYFSYFLKSLRP
jgi:hypothetical protein